MACKQQPGREARHGGVEVVARARRAAAGGLRAVRDGLAGAVTSDQLVAPFRSTLAAMQMSFARVAVPAPAPEEGREARSAHAADDPEAREPDSSDGAA